LRLNYHTLHVLKTAEPRLGKTLIINCNKQLVKCIVECVLNVLNGNIKFSVCNARKLVQRGDFCCPYWAPFCKQSRA